MLTGLRIEVEFLPEVKAKEVLTLTMDSSKPIMLRDLLRALDISDVSLVRPTLAKGEWAGNDSGYCNLTIEAMIR